jgi:hypothetical protein
LNEFQNELPEGATLLQTGGGIEDFDLELLRQQGANVVLERKSETQPRRVRKKSTIVRYCSIFDRGPILIIAGPEAPDKYKILHR